MCSETEEEKTEAAVQDNASSPFLSLSAHALNNLKLYSTAGDKVNQIAEALTVSEGDDGRNITAGYLTLSDKHNMQRSSSTQRGQFPRLLFQIDCNVT